MCKRRSKRFLLRRRACERAEAAPCEAPRRRVRALELEHMRRYALTCIQQWRWRQWCERRQWLASVAGNA
eukprot:6188647-Pleurochrysis_carterae.AAC.1